MISSNRDQLVAGFVTPAIKVSLQKSASELGFTVSMLISKLIVDHLEAQGIRISKADRELCVRGRTFKE